jgi:hypothetical protein
MTSDIDLDYAEFELAFDLLPLSLVTLLPTLPSVALDLESDL